eukprot:5966351-Pyramimonas_sp.AAC.1
MARGAPATSHSFACQRPLSRLLRPLKTRNKLKPPPATFLRWECKRKGGTGTWMGGGEGERKEWRAIGEGAIGEKEEWRAIGVGVGGGWKVDPKRDSLNASPGNMAAMGLNIEDGGAGGHD